MITLTTESNMQYMAMTKTPQNLKIIVNEYNYLRANKVSDAFITVDGTVMQDFELEEFFDGRLSSLEFYAGMIKAVEDHTIFEIRADRKAMIKHSEQEIDNGFEDGFAGVPIPENLKDNFFYGQGHCDGRACAYMCAD